LGGTKIWGKYIFRQHSQMQKNLNKISDDFFSHRQLFFKNYTLHSKFTPFSLYFSFFVSVSALFHVFLKK